MSSSSSSHSSRVILKYRKNHKKFKPNPDHYLFGAVLLSKRLELGLTQQSVGDQIGRSHTYVSNYELGRFRKIPTLSDFRAWCRVIRLNPVEVLYECGFLGSDEIQDFANELTENEQASPSRGAKQQ